MAPQKTRIRLVSSRGHLYAQEVRYEWDRTSQRGITHVIRTLGPMTPLRRPAVGGLDAGEIWLRLKLQREERSRARRPRLPFRTEHVAVDEAPSAERAIASDEPSPRITLTPPGRRSLTGSLGLGSFDNRVLRCVRQLGGQGTRSGVFEAVQTAGIPRPNHRQSLRRHVSFALTRLFRQKKVTRAGSGGRGDPYRYSSPP